MSETPQIPEVPQVLEVPKVPEITQIMPPAEEIAARMQEYVRVQQEIKSLNEKIKTLRQEVKSHETYFMHIFETCNKNEIKSDTGTIRVVKKVTKKPLKMDQIEGILKNEITDARTVAVVSKALEEKREIQKTSKIVLL